MNRRYPEFIASFWEKVDVRAGDSCWEWTGAKRNKKNYGNYRGMVASRVSWELANSLEIPEGKFVLHKCDNPICVRPDHLFIGTIKENAADMMAKGRKKTKINWGSAQKIRELAKSGVKQSVIAEMFGSCSANICQIVNNRRWVSVG